ncbi:MAG: type II toxin-antitoxin system RelE/ParE family toxin [Planctomycetaceae bacterium]|jgi:plasmid stabilization system protein ParE|nr:type II toxin-antitoxin system RelE/ParE family toxin [Planctomycetaceae bacterium]
MAGKKLKWSPRSRREVNKIFRFFYKRNGNNDYSRKLALEFKNTAKRIEFNENTGELIENNKGLVIRFVIVADNYKLIYRIEKEHNIVVTVWDARRNPDDLEL